MLDDGALSILNTLVNGGGTAIIVWLIMDMRREQREQQLRFWTLFEYLVKAQGIEIESIPRG